MLLGFILLFPLCESTVITTYTSIQAQTTHSSVKSTTTEAPSTETLPALEIVATPDYPVATGQNVQLYCNCPPISMSVNWTWLHLQNNSWETVGFARELTLTKPEESGVYQCKVKHEMQMRLSQNYTIYIVSFQVTVEEYLGTAAFALCIMIVVAIIAGVVWFVWQRFKDKPTTSSSPPNRSVPGPKVTPKACSPPADVDGDVYMNYANTNQSYVELTTAYKGQDNLYSTLS